MNDRLKNMWVQQEQFVDLLIEERGFPSVPVKITTKDGQRFLKGLTHDCMGELFEANQHLKNSKNHRTTDLPEIDRDAYIEELADAQHFLFEILIASGITLEEFYESYMSKGCRNFDRIRNGY